MLNDQAFALLDRLAHDLRAPIHNLLALCELLTSGTYGPVAPALEEPLADLQAQGTRMQDLVEETLDLVRLGGGRYQPEPSELSPSIAIERVAARYGAVVSGRAGATLHQDAAKLERMLDRLVRHAARTGRPTIEMALASALVVRIFPVADAAFDPLAAPQPLGPSVARALARLCKGDVTLENGAFVLTLPDWRSMQDA